MIDEMIRKHPEFIAAQIAVRAQRDKNGNRYLWDERTKAGKAWHQKLNRLEDAVADVYARLATWA